jgi:hypothetical protein
MKFPNKHVLELNATSKFAALICTNTTVFFMAVKVKELSNDVQQWVFGFCQEDPDISSSFVNDQ